MKKYLLLLCSLFLITISGFSQGEAYLIGDANQNEFFSIKTYDNALYAAGRIDASSNEYYGAFSRIDPATGTVIWTTQLGIESSLLDFVQDDQGGFIAVGREEPINDSGWQDNNSIIAFFDAGGNLLETQRLTIDNQGGRESFSKIIRHPDPADPDYPYYILGIVDRDGLTNANAFDDVLLINIDGAGNVNFSHELSHNISDEQIDDQFVRSFQPLPDGSGNLLLTGDIDNNGSGSEEVQNEPVVLVVGNQGQVLLNKTFDTQNFNSVQDAAILPSGDYVFVGKGNSNTNFITRMNSSLTSTFWTKRIPNFNQFIKIVAVGSTYYVLMEDGSNRYLINRIQDLGTNATLEWTKTLDDGDLPITRPFLLNLGTQMVYSDTRLPNTSAGTGTATGYGNEDILLAITGDGLETCITETVSTTLEDISIQVLDFPIDTVHIFMPAPLINNQSTPLDYESSPYCQDDCGEVLDSELVYSCSPPGSYHYIFNLQNNTSDFTVTSVALMNIQPAGTTIQAPLPTGGATSPFWNLNGSAPFFLPEMPPGGTTGPFEIVITPGSPFTAPIEVCFDIVYYSNTYECCRYEHCIIIEPIDPCANVDVNQLDNGESEACCYDLVVTNEYCPDYFTGILTEIVTPGVTFTGEDGATTWTPTIGTGGTVIYWEPITGTVPMGDIGDIHFCLEGIHSTTQVPQEVLIHWLAIDPATGEEVIVCTQPLTFYCQPCMDFGITGINCNADGTYTVDFTITNLSDSHTAEYIILESNTLNLLFDPALIMASIPPNTSYTGSFTVVDFNSPLLPPSSSISFKAMLDDGQGWCCHFDGLEFKLPDCGTQGPTCDCGTQGSFIGDVNQGFTFFQSCPDNTFTLTANALGPCDEVTWAIRDGDGANIDDQVLPGDQPATFSIPAFGAYTVEMTVIRFDDNMQPCFNPRSFSDMIFLACLTPQEGPILLSATPLAGPEFQLNWSIGEDQEFSHFIVRQGLSRIARIQSKTALPHYKYIFRKAQDGANEYQVIGVRPDGSQVASSIVKVTSDPLRLHPNPATSWINISAPKAGHYSLRIMDGYGKVVQRWQGQLDNRKGLNLNIQTLPDGLFFLQMQYEDGTVKEGKFVKM